MSDKILCCFLCGKLLAVGAAGCIGNTTQSLINIFAASCVANFWMSEQAVAGTAHNSGN